MTQGEEQYMFGTYKQSWGGAHPGCLILLLDQSGSMTDPFGNSQAGAGKRNCDMVATVLHGFLNELIVTNTIAQKDGTTELRTVPDLEFASNTANSFATALPIRSMR